TEIEAFEKDHESPREYSEMFFETSLNLVQVLGIVDDYVIANFTWPKALAVPQELQTEGVFIISTNRALSRLAFDGATHKQNMAKGSIQTLLVPVFVEFAFDEAATLRAMLKPLDEAGISISDFGKNSFLVQAIPSYLDTSSIGDILKELVASETNDIPALLAKACKNVASSKPLTVDMASHIINKLLECNNPFHCPAGDKIVCMLAKTELEKKFR
ncbi:MAG: hypothetical protein LLF94_08585, partial [Chlamydiales bacterium]|nr:hypothetical protein [Chlamydiales bacterium]